MLIHALAQVALDLAADVPVPPPGAGSDVLPNPPASLPPGVSQYTNLLVSYAKGFASVGGIVGFLICSMVIIVGHRNRGQMATDGFIHIIRVAGGLALASVATALVGIFVL